MSQYLERHAEPEARLASCLADRYLATLVVPACGELASLLDGFQAALTAAPARVLLVLVVNATEAASAATHADNARLLAHLAGLFPAHESFDGATLGRATYYDLLWIDRASAGRYLPPREGVGLARKIGADFAAASFAMGRVACPRLACSDADVTLPSDYFASLTRESAGNGASAAWLWPFRHEPGGDAAIDEATVLYEISLRYYVLGLASAGSPYAYQSIGSTLCIDAEAYQSVRGFPKREAGEDFYVLDKLSKVAPLRRIVATPLSIRARASARVPFGTGRRSGEIAADSAQGRGFELYDPELFRALSAVQRGLNDLAESAELGALESALSVLGIEHARSARLVLDALGATKALASAIQQAPRGAVLRRRIHTWFDALRTLRFVHGLRDSGYSSRPWREALDDAPFICEPFRSGNAPDAVCRELVRQEAELPALVGPSLG